jgi:drug/metabolite transporter (DMT)-like permease
MLWVLFVVGAVVSWGMYGAMLHMGQQRLGPMKALLCVGFAYFLVGVLVPVAALASQGELKGFTANGTTIAVVAGILGAAGAVCIIYSFRYGGLPIYVMPLVFAGAPLVNVIFTAILHPPKERPSPLLYFGFLLASIGAGMVLYFRPKS